MKQSTIGIYEYRSSGKVQYYKSRCINCGWDGKHRVTLATAIKDANRHGPKCVIPDDMNKTLTLISVVTAYR